jgi:tRNA dimethylallyltransferase
MTYFRGMERRGIKIHWIDGTLPLKKKIDEIKNICCSAI